MEIGNKYAGGDLSESYCSFFIFPLGIELYLFNEDTEICLTLWPFKLTFGMGKNRTLFH
tara:strand:+ start:151 stop:327 length:177 start_codon:yes stop_codon:yes gene_type:complete